MTTSQRIKRTIETGMFCVIVGVNIWMMVKNIISGNVVTAVISALAIGFLVGVQVTILLYTCITRQRKAQPRTLIQRGFQRGRAR